MLLIHEGAGLLAEDLSRSQDQFMYAEKENIAQLLINKPDTGIQITFTITKSEIANLAEVLDQIMKCVHTYFPSIKSAIERKWNFI